MKQIKKAWRMSRMLGRMLKSDWFSYVRRPCPRVNLTKPLRSRVLDTFRTITMPRQKKDWYLYMIVVIVLILNYGVKCRTIDEFCKKSNSLFELVHDFGDSFIKNNDYSCVETCITAGPNFYMVNFEGKVEGYFFDPANLDGQSIRRLEHAAIPRLVDPIYWGMPIICSIGNKIYVLASYAGRVEDNHEQPPLFKVYDPLSRTWTHLPSPPYFDKFNPSYLASTMEKHFVWGHKLGVWDWHGAFLIFDTHQQTWTQVGWKRRDYCRDSDSEDDRTSTTDDEILSRWCFAAVVEFEGFLIGIPGERRSQLVAYQSVGFKWKSQAVSGAT